MYIKENSYWHSMILIWFIKLLNYTQYQHVYGITECLCNFFLLRLEGSVQAAQEEYDRIQKQVCRNKLYNMKKSPFI